jgi:hypothetical protein
MSPGGLRAVADNGGYVLADDGARLLFLQRRILPSWAAFVPGLLAVIALGNGAVQLGLGHLVPGGVLVVVGAVAGFGLRAALGRRRRARAAPLDPGSAVLVIDLGAQTLLDGAGRTLAPLHAVRLERSMQATSSARAIRIVWPGGAEVVYRGDALVPGGSIGAAVEALRTRGLFVTG